MIPARISAVALLLMALGLGILYHHAPYFWAARTATIVGALLPAVFLARRMPSRLAAVLAAVIAMLLGWTLGAGLLTSDPWLAYRPYQVAVVGSQWLLLAIWGLWWHETAGDRALWRACPVALLGVLLAAGGASMATLAHWEVGYRSTPPAPWDDPRINVPADMLSRVAPELLAPEAIQIGIAVGVAAVVFLWPWVRRGLR